MVLRKVFKVLNAVSFVGYVGAVFVFGLTGLLFPQLDLKLLIGFDFGLVGPSYEAMTDILHPYRFLKALNVGFGVFAILFIKEIYTIPRFNYYFLGVILAGALARVLSLVVDGVPNMMLVWFTMLEFFFVLSMFGYSRFTLNDSKEARECCKQARY